MQFKPLTDPIAHFVIVREVFPAIHVVDVRVLDVEGDLIAAHAFHGVFDLLKPAISVATKLEFAIK